MKAPNRICYCENYDGSYFIDCDGAFIACETLVEYIHKDALLEWAEKRKKDLIETLNAT